MSCVPFCRRAGWLFFCQAVSASCLAPPFCLMHRASSAEIAKVIKNGRIEDSVRLFCVKICTNRRQNKMKGKSYDERHSLSCIFC